MPVCATHAERRAEYRCVGCRAFLCAECIEEGHRLFFCRRCREQALPLAADAPATAPELARARRLGRRYGLREVFLYPFRGFGGYTLPALALFLTVAELVGGIGGFLLRALILLMLPGLLFEIARTSAEGDDQLPDWPDASQAFERFAEIGRGLLVFAVALTPAWLALRATGCDLEPYLRTLPEGACVATLFGALALGLLLGVFAFGATSAHGTGWLALRVDLHLEALLGPAGRDGAATALLVAALVAGARLAAAALGFLPLLGAAAAGVLTTYALFVGAHLIGRLFLRHAKTLDPLYRE